MTPRRMYLALIVAACTALSSPASGAKRNWNVSDIVGWYCRLGNASSENIKVQVTRRSVTFFYDGPSTWSAGRGRFEKLGRNLFALIPEESTDEKGNDLLAKGWCAFLKIEISDYSTNYEAGERPVISIRTFVSMKELRANDTVCPGLSYFPINPPFDKPMN